MKKVKSSVSRMQNHHIRNTQAMKKTRSRRRIALTRRLALIAVVFVVVGFGLTYMYTKQALALKDKQAEQIKTEKQLVNLKQEEKALKNQINKLHDDDYIAKLARSEYYLSKDGEIIFNTPNDSE
nr:septum formation initiator family protein [Listeria sp. PSOL-1]